MLICSELCDHKNEGLDSTSEKVPQGDSFDFVLVPVRPEADTENAEQEASIEEAVPVKKESKGMVVYCMDISSSMGMTVNLPQLQDTYDHLLFHGFLFVASSVITRTQAWI